MPPERVTDPSGSGSNGSSGTESGGTPRPDVDALLETLRAGAVAVHQALASIDDLRAPGERRGQYGLDLVADEALLAVLHAAGLEVFSEESGRTAPPGGGVPGLLVVVDPVDGSTNASIGLPWYATSCCVLDERGPLVGLVANLVSGARFEAVRGGGAELDGIPIAPSGCEELRAAVVGVSGSLNGHPGWAQYRALGAASLDICAVASGVLDGYRVTGRSALHGWDYLAALLVSMEAGAVVGELDGAELVVRDASRRRPVVAATAALAAALGQAPV